jgi:hypothetical protein
MGFGRLLALVIGLAAVAFAVKYALDGGLRNNAPHTVPRQQLDNVRDKTHELEKEMQKAADDAARNLDQK